MSSDAKWLLDMFEMQKEVLWNKYKKGMHPDKIERISYCRSAITEVLMAINDYSGYISVSLIRDVLKMLLDDYKRYYSSNREIHKKFLYSAQMIESLLSFTDMYIETNPDEYL